MILFYFYLIPGISSVWWVDEDRQDFSFGQQGCGSFRGYVWVKVAGTLLKHVVCADVGGEWEKLHVPDNNNRCMQVKTWYFWCTSSLNGLFFQGSPKERFSSCFTTDALPDNQGLNPQPQDNKTVVLPHHRWVWDRGSPSSRKLKTLREKWLKVRKIQTSIKLRI